MASPYAGMTAVLYARVSTDDKGQDPEVQVLKMKEWCETNDVQILGIYREEKSGKNMERPEMDRVIGRIARGGVNILLAFDVSRIGRNASDVDKIRKTAGSYNTVIRYVTSDVAPETGAGRLINGVEAWQAEEHLVKHRNAVKAGMDKAKVFGTASGMPIGRPPTIVVTNGVRSREAFSEEKPKPIVDIDRVMELADKGNSLSAAANAIDVPPSTLIEILSRMGLREEYERRRSECPVTVERIMELADRGMNMMEISAMLQCSVSTIREKLIAADRLPQFRKTVRAVRRLRKRMPTETSPSLYTEEEGDGGVRP